MLDTTVTIAVDRSRENDPERRDRRLKHAVFAAYPWPSGAGPGGRPIALFVIQTLRKPPLCGGRRGGGGLNLTLGGRRPGRENGRVEQRWLRPDSGGGS